MNRPAWTLSEAVHQCAVSRSTLRRRVNAGDFPNAYKDTAGQWRIPVTDLIAAGLTPGSKTWLIGAQDGQAGPAHDNAQTASPQIERVRELEAELAHERTRREAAEAIAEERAARIQDLQLAMRLLEAAPSTPRSPGVAADPAHEQVDPVHERTQAASPQFTGWSGEHPGQVADPAHEQARVLTEGDREMGREASPRRSWIARLLHL